MLDNFNLSSQVAVKPPAICSPHGERGLIAASSATARVDTRGHPFPSIQVSPILRSGPWSASTEKHLCKLSCRLNLSAMSSRDDTFSVRPQLSGERGEMVKVSTFVCNPSRETQGVSAMPEGIFIFIGTVYNFPCLPAAAALPAWPAHHNSVLQPTSTSQDRI